MRKIILFLCLLFLSVVIITSCGETPADTTINTNTDTNTEINTDTDTAEPIITEHQQFFTSDQIVQKPDNTYIIVVNNLQTDFDFSQYLHSHIRIFCDMLGKDEIITRCSPLLEGDNIFYLFNGEKTISLNIYRKQMVTFCIKGTSSIEYEEGTIIEQAPVYKEDAINEFLGWREEYGDKADVEFPLVLDRDYFICAKTQTKQYNMYVQLLDGTILTVSTSALNKSVYIPSYEAKPLYKLVGYTSGDEYFKATFDADTNKTWIRFDDYCYNYGEQTFVPVYEPIQYSLHAYGFSLPIDKVDITTDLSSIVLPEASTMIKENYQFIEFQLKYTNYNNEYISISIPAGEALSIPFEELNPANHIYGISIDAVYKEVKRSFSLSYGNGAQCITNTYVLDKNNITEVPVPTKEGFVFMGWYYSTQNYLDTQYKFNPFAFDLEQHYASTLYACWSSEGYDNFEYAYTENNKVIITNYKLKDTEVPPVFPTTYCNYSVSKYLLGSVISQQTNTFYTGGSSLTLPIDLSHCVFDGTYCFGEFDSAIGKIWYFEILSLDKYTNRTFTNPDGSYAIWTAKTLTMEIYDSTGTLIARYTNQ